MMHRAVEAVLAAGAMLLAAGPATAAGAFAVIRGPDFTWLVEKASIRGAGTARAFSAYQVNLKAQTVNGHQSNFISSVWFADCAAHTLAFAQANSLDADLKPLNNIFPRGGPGHQQVLPTGPNAVLRQVENTVCGVGAVDWIEAGDVGALMRDELQRRQRGG